MAAGDGAEQGEGGEAGYQDCFGGGGGSEKGQVGMSSGIPGARGGKGEDGVEMGECKSCVGEGHGIEVGRWKVHRGKVL